MVVTSNSFKSSKVFNHLKIQTLGDPPNSVLLVKIGLANNCPFGKKRFGPVWFTIYHHLPVVKGVSSTPSINQPTNGKRTSMDSIL